MSEGTRGPASPSQAPPTMRPQGQQAQRVPEPNRAASNPQPVKQQPNQAANQPAGSGQQSNGQRMSKRQARASRHSNNAQFANGQGAGQPQSAGSAGALPQSQTSPAPGSRLAPPPPGVRLADPKKPTPNASQNTQQVTRVTAPVPRTAGSPPSANATAVAPAVAAGAARTAVVRSPQPQPAPAPRAGEVAETDARHRPGAARRTRKARLRLSRLDPWSVMKTSFLFSIAAGIMLVVAVYVVWTVIGSSGLFDSLNTMVASVVSTPGDTTPFRVQEYLNTSKVMGVTALLACVDVVIITALSTLASFLYNLAATMLGGLEITLAED